MWKSFCPLFAKPWTVFGKLSSVSTARPVPEIELSDKVKQAERSKEKQHIMPQKIRMRGKYFFSDLNLSHLTDFIECFLGPRHTKKDSTLDMYKLK